MSRRSAFAARMILGRTVCRTHALMSGAVGDSGAVGPRHIGRTSTFAVSDLRARRERFGILGTVLPPKLTGGFRVGVVRPALAR